MKEQIIKAIINSLGSPDIDENTYKLYPYKGEWWISHNIVGSGEPVKDWLNREIKIEYMSNSTLNNGWICPRCQKVHSWLSMTCDCPPNVITASTIESKEVTEIKGENNCNNCKWGKCLTKDWPCNDCKWGKCLTKDWPCNDCKWGICLTKDWPCNDCNGSNKWEPIKTE
jgi:hypothetical protein